MKYNYNYDDNVRKKIYNYVENKLVIWEKDQNLWKKKNDDCGDNDEKNKYIKFEDQE